MKKNSFARSAFFHPRTLVALLLCMGGAFFALIAFGMFSGSTVVAQSSDSSRSEQPIQVVQSYKNDVSPPMRDVPEISARASWKEEHEANENPKVPHRHQDMADPVIQNQQFKAAGTSSSVLNALAPSITTPLTSFDGIVFPGVGCNCAPPDTNGAVGQTQYVQIVNEGYQVFDKNTTASVLGPKSISSVWTGFGGACETGGAGDPVVLYDHLANHWLISQFAKATSTGPITDECVAISTTADATGTYYRYGFHLGSNFYDYPHLSVWPDGYYMSMNVFNAAGTSYLGPQAFAFDRAKMLTGAPASFVSPVGPLGGTVDPFLPADLDGPTLPPNGAPATFVGFPGQATNPNYTTYHFHADFVTPANSKFTTFANPPAAGYTSLCPSTRACVPQAGVSSANNLDGVGDRLLFRLAYRNFGDHEAVVGTYAVSANAVAGLRWFELRNVTAGPVGVYQEGTYQPDSTWRWMSSAAMDGQGNLAIGYSASSGTINPQLRYNARLATDPVNILTQGESHLIDGTGSQSGTGNRWGDYSALTVDPVDDSTFWFTSEYYSTSGTYNWRTRIGSFKLAAASPTPTPSPTPVPTATPTPTPTPTPAPDFSMSISPASQTVPRAGGTASYSVAITPSNGFSSPVSLSVSGLPSGASSTFSPNPTTSTSTLTVTVPSTSARGTYTLTVTGSGGSPTVTHTATATLQKTKQ
ncbi:MAG: hypothetical protein M3032_05265 [Verrucomicrobiota bacterium]|nr:hypothetical protein [Verrucomicrobiota bacterium]